MVSSLSKNSSPFNNYPVAEGPIATEVKGQAMVAPAENKPVDAMEVSGSKNTGNKTVSLSAAIKMPANTVPLAAELEVTVVAAETVSASGLKEELRQLFNGDAKTTKALNELLGNKEFRHLDEDSQVAILSQCKNYPNTNSIAGLKQLLSTSWFKGQDLADKQRSAKSIAFLAETAREAAAGNTQATHLQKDIIENTLKHLLADEIKMDFHAFDDDPDGITLGHSHSEEKLVSINSALVLAGNSKFPDDVTAAHPEDTEYWSEMARMAILETIPHEVSHAINNDLVTESYEYFQDEYRAWFVGFVADKGRFPTNAEAFDQSWWLVTCSDGAYGYIRRAFTGADDIATKSDTFGKEFFNFFSKMATVERVDLTTGEKVDDFRMMELKNPDAQAPFPDGAILDNRSYEKIVCSGEKSELGVSP